MDRSPHAFRGGSSCFYLLLDAALISHPHQDHFGLVASLPTGTPVYIGKLARSLIHATQVFIGKDRYADMYPPSRYVRQRPPLHAKMAPTILLGFIRKLSQLNSGARLEVRDRWMPGKRRSICVCDRGWCKNGPGKGIFLRIPSVKENAKSGDSLKKNSQIGFTRKRTAQVESGEFGSSTDHRPRFELEISRRICHTGEFRGRVEV